MHLVAEADLGEPFGLPRRDTPAGRFRSLVEQLCAEAGFTPRVAYEIDDLPAAHAFVAAGIAVGAMHGLTLAAAPPDVSILRLAESPAGSRAIEALAPTAGRAAAVDDLVDQLARAAQAWSRRHSVRSRAWATAGDLSSRGAR